MTKNIFPALVAILLYVGLQVYLHRTAPALPKVVATHFDAKGKPNGWMNRSGYLHFIGTFGAALPGFTILIGLLSSLLPSRMINIPQRDYWLSPAQSTTTRSYLFRHCLWLGCLELGLVIGLHHLTLTAVQNTPQHLPADGSAILIGGFMGGVAIWLGSLIWRFRRPA